MSDTRQVESPLRVLIVDDSFAYRMFLRELLSRQPDMEVVGEAGNGLSATRFARELAPDVVLMDVSMPGMNGIEAVRRMRADGVEARIIMVSAFEDPAALKDTLKAGVRTTHRKGPEKDEGWSDVLLDSIRNPRKTASESSPGIPPGSEQAVLPVRGKTRRRHPLPKCIRAVLVGASTGGPQAVAQVLSGLPDDLPVPVVIVIHVGAAFDVPMAETLAANSGKPVRLVTGPVPLGGAPGRFLLAPAGRHLKLNKGVLCLDDGPLRHSVRPSVDELFESAADSLGGEVMAVLMTGMGKDGAEGLRTLHDLGAVTLVQDRDSSAVFGMPAEAIRLGAARNVVPLDELARWMRATLARVPLV